MTKIGEYEVRDGRTCVTVTLLPGESAIIVLDLAAEAGETVHAVSSTADQIRFEDDALMLVAEKSGNYETVLSTGEKVRTAVTVPEPVVFTDFDITIEDWNAGEKKINIEEKFGHTTTEVYYETKKTQLVFKNSRLMPWKELPASVEQLESLGYKGAKMQDVS